MIKIEQLLGQELTHNPRLDEIKEEKAILTKEDWNPGVSVKMVDLNKEQILLENPPGKKDSILHSTNPKARDALVEVEAHRMEARRLIDAAVKLRPTAKEIGIIYGLTYVSGYLATRAERIRESIVNEHPSSPTVPKQARREPGEILSKLPR